MSDTPIIFHIPHASVDIPIDIRQEFCLLDADLSKEILLMTDHFTDDLFTHSASTHDSVIKFPVSRLVLDPERFANDADEPMSNVGMGAIYMRRHDGLPLRRNTLNREELLNRYYYPHHKEIERITSKHLSQYHKALIIDCHSFPSKALPYEINQNGPRPEICLGTDEFHTPSWLSHRMHDEFRSLGYTVEFDTPFSGTFVPSIFLRSNPRVMSIMIELRRDLYMQEHTGLPNERYSRILHDISSAISNIRRYF